MNGRGTSSQRSGVVLLSRDVVLASWLRYLCAPSVRVVAVGSGYEAAAEVLASPAEALVIDFRAMSAAHQRLLDTARALGMQILGIGKVPSELSADALSLVRLVSQADLPDALREVLSSQAAGAAPAIVATGPQDTRQDAASTMAGAAERPLEPGRKRPRRVKLVPKHAPQGQAPQGPASAGPASRAPPPAGSAAGTPGQEPTSTPPAPTASQPAGEPAAPSPPTPAPGRVAAAAAAMAAAAPPRDTPEPSVIAADLLAEKVPPAPADRPIHRPAQAAAAASASAPPADAPAPAEAVAKAPKQPSDLLTPEEVAALLETDL
jgi:hypothetical protein